MSNEEQKNSLLSSRYSNPVTEWELTKSKRNKILTKSIILIVIDLLLSITLNILECIYLKNESTKIRLYIEIIILSVLYIAIIILLFLCNYILSFISLISFAIIGGLYFIYKLYLQIKIIYNGNKDSSEQTEYNPSFYANYFDMIQLTVYFLILIIRIFCFYFLVTFKDSVEKLDEINKLYDHENFIEKLASKNSDRDSNENKFNNSDRWTVTKVVERRTGDSQGENENKENIDVKEIIEENESKENIELKENAKDNDEEDKKEEDNDEEDKKEEDKKDDKEEEDKEEIEDYKDNIIEKEIKENEEEKEQNIKDNENIEIKENKENENKENIEDKENNEDDSI